MFEATFFPERFYGRRYFPEHSGDPVPATGMVRVFAVSPAVGIMSSSAPRFYASHPSSFQALS